MDNTQTEPSTTATRETRSRRVSISDSLFHLRIFWNAKQLISESVWGDRKTNCHWRNAQAMSYDQGAFVNACRCEQLIILFRRLNGFICTYTNWYIMKWRIFISPQLFCHKLNLTDSCVICVRCLKFISLFMEAHYVQWFLLCDSYAIGYIHCLLFTSITYHYCIFTVSKEFGSLMWRGGSWDWMRQQQQRAKGIRVYRTSQWCTANSRSGRNACRLERKEGEKTPCLSSHVAMLATYTSSKGAGLSRMTYPHHHGVISTTLSSPRHHTNQSFLSLFKIFWISVNQSESVSHSFYGDFQITFHRDVKSKPSYLSTWPLLQGSYIPCSTFTSCADFDSDPGQHRARWRWHRGLDSSRLPGQKYDNLAQ